MDKDRILAIEDDEGVCRLLRHSLAREDYHVRIANSGEEGLEEAFREPPDLILLDLELPGIDGLSVCRELKSDNQTRNLPIIILSGKGEESDVVQGLEMGADDYIVKPFSPKILNARLQAVLRRRTQLETPPANAEVFEFGPLRVDTSNNSIRVFEKELELSPPEYQFALHLICHLSGEDFSSCPQISPDENPVSVIGREGMVLYSENRLGKLLPVFEGLDSVDGVEAAVLSAFYGMALLESDPDRACGYLADSERRLEQDNDPRAELVVLSFLVFFHVVFDGDSRRANGYLERAEALSRAIFDRLSVFSRVVVAQNLAIGRGILQNDFDISNEYLSIAEALAEDRGLVNLVALNRIVEIVEAYVRGDLEAMVAGLEDCRRFVNHPQVNRLHRLFIKLLQFKYFSLAGDFRFLGLEEKGLREQFHRLLDSDYLLTGQLAICLLEGLHYEERYEEALQFGSEILQRRKIAANDLLRPLLNGFVALHAASCGNQPALEEALAACRAESGTMTARLAQARLYCARALALSGVPEEAGALLAEILAVARERGWHILALQARAQQLLLADESGPAAESAVGQLVADMQERGIWYLQSLIGEDYCRLYELSISAGVVSEFPREMLRRRLSVDVDPDGSYYPLLRISTLGGLRVSLGGELVARTDEFSRSQRECLALLAAAPDHRIIQEEVQLIFWPDSQPEKARSNLDTMLSRFRRTLKEKLHPQPVKRYLKLQKGVLSLEGVVVDAVDVIDGIARARELVRRREFWQADTSFTVALSLWHGQFMPGSCSADPAAAYAGKLQQLCTDAAFEWSSLLNESGQVGRAIEVLTHALSMDRSNEFIMKALYRSHMRDGNISMAHQLLQQFENVLRSEGYGASEIARVLTSFKVSGKG